MAIARATSTTRSKARGEETVVLNVIQHQLGKRMYHCHILEHESQGMMGVLNEVA